MSLYAADFLASLSDGALADFLYEAIDIHFGRDDHPEILQLAAEVKRRGLTSADLGTAYDDMVAHAQLPLFS